jgi:hypothetical protein
VSWGVIGGIGSIVAPIAGALITSNASDNATDRAVAGEERNIEFQRESRDMARADQEPWRQSGVTALNALMSMTGLGGGVGAGGFQQSTPSPGAGPAPNDVDSFNAWNNGEWSPASSYQGPNTLFNADGSPAGRASAYGGDGRNDRYGQGAASGGPMTAKQSYIVNELGPESVYQGGSYTRNSAPQTIAPTGRGYVHPNKSPIGLDYGGTMDPNLDSSVPPVEWGGPSGGVTNNGGGSNNNNNGSNNNGGGSSNGAKPSWRGRNGPRENRGGVRGGYNFMTDPGYQFRFEEGQRALERGAAANGGLLSGGFGRQMTRYGQDYASNEYGNVYNRIANIAGLGQVATNQSGQYAMNAGQGMGQSAANGGMSSAYGAQNQGNIWANAGNQIAQGVNWGNVFGGGGGSSSGGNTDWVGPR